MDLAQRSKLLEQADKAVETLMEATVELSFEQAPPPTAAAGPSGSRKRAREVEQSHEQALAAAETEVAEAERRAKKAWMASEKAEQKVDAKRKILDQALAAEAQMDNATLKVFQQFMKLFERADKGYSTAIDESLFAEIEALRAELAVKEAENLVLRLEWGNAVHQFGSALAD